ncbi:MAG: FAD-dependent oxidoreductase, partial [Methylococcales bacterium]
MNLTRTTLLTVIVCVIALFFLFDLQQFFSLDNLKSQQAAIADYRSNHPLSAILIYMLIYIAVTGLSLPGATVMTLAGGAVFGLFWGTLIVSFASTIGATLAFLAARYLFRDAVSNRFGDRLSTVNSGIAKDGAYYLFSLRLVPLFPFFVINMVMGLTPIKTATFYWVSQIGMLAGTIVYVNAGTQLAQLESLAGILSPGLLLSFALLGVFPLLAKQVTAAISAQKIYKPWPKPSTFDNNIVVIGAGSGGLVSAYLAAAMKAKVTLIEQHKMGGDCLNTGCVPSKALIRAAKQVAQIKTAHEFGIKTSAPKVDFAAVMARVQQVIKTIAPHDSIERYQELGVNVLQGSANIISPWLIEVSNDQETQTISTRNIIIAAGAKPFIPAIPGLETINYLTSDNIWQLSELPKHLLILGGGPIGCELAQCFARLGSKVTIVEMAERLLMREDPDVSELIGKQFVQDGINILTSHTAKRFSEQELLAEHDQQEVTITFDKVLIAIG